MQHSAIVNKSDSVIIFAESVSDMPEIKVYKLSNSFEFSEIIDINFIVLTLADNYYKCGFKAPNEDCYLCIKFANDVTFVRVGSPITCILHYTKNIGDVLYKQIDAADGRIIVSGKLDKLIEGFYYKKITSQNYSIIKVSINNFNTSSVLKLPYPDSNSGGEITTGYSAVENFVYLEKLTSLGFLGDRNSGFDRTLGRWVYRDIDAVVADLARAICYKYNLEWDKQEDESNWIGNYVKYINTQDNVAGSVLSYRPGSTPDNNRNNYPLIIDDLLGNTIVRGLSIYLSRPLEIISDIEGALFSFRNRN